MRRRHTLARVGALVGAALLLACASPEQRYRVLSFFFDGVPRPAGDEAAPEAPKTLETAAREPEHAPVVEWIRHEPDCDECHRRGASNRLMAKREVICWKCHDLEDYDDDVRHGPFASGDCLACHSPHRSRYPSLLLRPPGIELCEGCHTTLTFPSLGDHRARSGDACLDCHDPHASGHAYMLEDDPAEL